MTKREFADLTLAMFTLLGQDEPSKQTLAEWWDDLNHIDFKRLETAYDALVDHKAMPTIENVLSFVKPIETVPNTQQLKYPLKADGKDWSRKILNHPHGRPEIALKYARTALNIKA